MLGCSEGVPFGCKGRKVTSTSSTILPISDVERTGEEGSKSSLLGMLC